VNGTTVTAINATTGLYTTGLINSTNTTASTSTTTGALVVGSNVGLSGNSGGANWFGGERLISQMNQNAPTRLQVRNDTSGSAAQAQVSATLGDFTTYTAMGSLSAGFTTSGLFAANTGYIASNATAGLNIFTAGSTSLTLGTNSTAALTLASNGAATFAGNAIVSKVNPELISRSTSDAAGQIQYLTFGSPTYNRAQFRSTSAGVSDGSLQLYTFNAGSPTLAQTWSSTGASTFASTTASTSTTTGALIVSGGAGFAGNIHSGGTGNFNGVVTSLGGNAGVQVYDRSVGASDAWLMSATGGSNLTFVNNGNSELTVAKGGAVTARGSLRSTSATGGIGYATGAGGAVTQGTSRTTGVTLNNVAGAITLFTAAGSATWQSFTVTNSAVAATDTIIVNQRSGTDLYMMHVTAVGAGSFRISFATTGGTTSEAPVFNFAVIKAVSS
jgi:hypothetical protein